MTSTPFRSVWFDCDSTLTGIEGVDELGRFATPEIRAELRALTQQAMAGERPLAEVYEARLRLCAPTKAQLDEIGRLYVAATVPDAALVVAALQAADKLVGIVSGGLAPAVLTLARHLGIAPARVHAVPVRFDGAGRFVDFDHESPLWRNDGKTEVLRLLPDSERPLCLCGDGVTDLEAAATAELFVGFGGVARRASVEQRAACYLAGPGLAPLLRIVLTEAERKTLRQDPRFAQLVAAAERD